MHASAAGGSEVRQCGPGAKSSGRESEGRSPPEAEAFYAFAQVIKLFFKHYEVVHI